MRGILLIGLMTAAVGCTAANAYIAKHGTPDLISESAGDLTRIYDPVRRKDLPRWESHAVELYYLGKGIKVELKDGRVFETKLTTHERDETVDTIRRLGGT